MKSVIVSLLALVATTAAHAEVKRPGTFVPNLCSVSGLGHPTRPSIVAVKEVCVGKIAGFDKEALEITTNDGEKRIYEITVRRAPGRPRMGQNVSPFEGHRFNQRVRDDVEGKLVFTTGITTSWQISLKTSSNLEFKGNMEQVFVTE